MIANQKLDGGAHDLRSIDTKNQYLYYECEIHNHQEYIDLLAFCRKFFAEGIAIGARPQSFKPQAIFFDFDSTVIQEESFVEVAKLLGLEELIEKVTNKAMAGEITFVTSFKKRLKLLQGLSQEKIMSVVDQCTFTKGLVDFANTCKQQQIPLFVISGGLKIIAEKVCQKIGITGLCANEIEIKQGVITGDPKGDMVDENYKLGWVKQTCADYSFNLSSVVAVGDGANDKQMLSAAGIGVGFSPKKVLWPYIDVFNGFGDHGFMKYFLGLDFS